MKISVVVITYNEERNIRRCLESVKGIADEMVVVDSGSQDRTIEICKETGARVIHQPFLGYVEQKNFALRQAKNDWVLSLDADEALTSALEQSILSVSDPKQADGYSMNRLTNYCGKWIRHGGWYPDRKIRFFNRHTGQWTGINGHDSYTPFRKTSVLHLKGDILHYSYPSLSHHLQKINEYSTMGAMAMYEDGKRSSILKILIKPVARFFRHYILKAGFLDGLMGYTIAVNTAHASFLKYLRLYYLQKGRTI